MKKTFAIAVLLVGVICCPGCTKEKNYKDRSEANDMFGRICKLTKDYTAKVADSPDSVSWAAACAEFEDKLDKINFSYSPDTDLLLTEGQNDTIHSLMLDYIKARDERIRLILHPEVEVDSLVDIDSMKLQESIPAINLSDASRSPGN